MDLPPPTSTPLSPPALPQAYLHQDLSPLLIGIRRHLHRNPELGLVEHETARFIRETLESHGLTDVVTVAGTGCYVDIAGPRPGRKVGYRADIDALPTQDAKHVPYASRNAGVAHLCGHDAHTAVGIGVALLLHNHRDRLAGTVRVFFQPNEEGSPSGAPLMIHDGVLDGIEAAYAVHVDPTLPTGRFGLIKGPATASVDQIQIDVHGPSTGHSARPHDCVDTVWVATQLATTLYQLAGRVTDPRNPAVLTLCRLRAGEAYNVIPDHVEMGGTLRCTVNPDREKLQAMIRSAAHSLADLHGARIDVDYQGGVPAVMNHAGLVDHVAARIHNLYGPEAAVTIPRPSMGAEDFAHYLDYVPGALVRTGTCSGPETRFPLHDAHFDIDEQALAPTALLMADVLQHHLETEPLAR